jgi:hypothetical protein
MMQRILFQLLKFVKKWVSDYEDDVTFTQRILNDRSPQQKPGKSR